MAKCCPISRECREAGGGFHLALKTGNFGWNVKRNNAFRNKPPGKCGTPPEVILFFENSETTEIFGSRSHFLGLGRKGFSVKTRKFRVECQKERYISKERGIFRFNWKLPSHLTRSNSENSNRFLGLNGIRPGSLGSSVKIGCSLACAASELNSGI